MTKRKLVCAYATNCELLDKLSEENEQLKDENEALKLFIAQLTNKQGQILLMNGNVYNVKKILGDMNE